MKVGLFIPCYINAVYPQVGVASFKLLKSLGVDVDYPLDSLLFVGPTGVGKTEVAKVLASELGISLVRFDSSSKVRRMYSPLTVICCSLQQK